MQKNWKSTWASKTAGICCTVAGVIGILGAASLLARGILIGTIGAVAERLIPLIGEWLSFWPWAVDIPTMIAGGAGIASQVSLALGGVMLAIGIIALIAGILALMRKAWRLALVGSILAIASSPPLGLVATILTALSKDEFQVKS
jgi:hypothetical protein